MTEATNKPSPGDAPGEGPVSITGTRLAGPAPAPEEGVSGATPAPDGTRLRVVTVAPGAQAFSELEVPSRDRRDPYVGSVIDGRYRVETILGEGGMGVVYRCSHTIIGKKLALKVLRADLARDSEVTERFLNEARAASAIGNPHIIDISDFGQFPDGATYFVMEFLTGRALHGVGSDGQRMSMDRILKVARQLGEGLAAAHAAGIVHRDLKPDNIFLIERGADKEFVKILDFGIAKVSTSEGKLTRAGAVFGTPHYMSPEQAAGTSVDARGDIYSLGVILYELVSGRVPFDADNFMGVLTQHMYKAPNLLTEVTADAHLLPPGLEAIVMKCLAKRPEQRYQSMNELVADIDKVLAGRKPVASREAREDLTEPGSYYDDQASSRPGRTRLKYAWLGAGLAVAVAAAVAVLTRKPVNPPAVPITVAPLETPKPGEQKGEVAPPATPGPAVRQVLVGTEPLSAQIYRGTESLGMSPVSVSVTEGQSVELTIKAAGFKDTRVVVDGSEPSLSIRLEAAAGHARPAAKGALKTAPPKAPPPAKRPSLGGGEIVDPWGK
jgi:tRNA A-37 threonylcarbamoyl transferase component Bud32